MVTLCFPTLDPPRSYRRLDVWLRHGLSSDSPASALAAALQLCQLAGGACSPVPFMLSLPSRGRARLSVPDLQPSSQYQ